MGILSEAPRSATIMAAEQTTALRIDKRVFLELLAQFPQIALAVMRELANAWNGRTPSSLPSRSLKKSARGTIAAICPGWFSTPGDTFSPAYGQADRFLATSSRQRWSQNKTRDRSAGRRIRAGQSMMATAKVPLHAVPYPVRNARLTKSLVRRRSSKTLLALGLMIGFQGMTAGPAAVATGSAPPRRPVTPWTSAWVVLFHPSLPATPDCSPPSSTAPSRSRSLDPLDSRAGSRSDPLPASRRRTPTLRT